MHKVDETLVANFIDLCEENEGEHILKLKLYDQEEEIKLDLLSKTKRINANYKFVQAIEEMGMTFKLN